MIRVDGSGNSSSLIKVRGLNKTYKRGGEQIQVLQGLNLDVDKGDFVAFMGPSGSGKTTLLTLLGGLDVPSAGSITVDGDEVTHMSASKLTQWRARHVGFIFQMYNLIPVLTAFQNVELPLLLTKLSKSERRKHVETALGVVGLAERMNHYPRQLSGGQEQRVAIARAIVADPTFLLCDEPTGDLDRKSADEIMELIHRLVKEHGKTVLMVTHDPVVAKRADLTLHLEKGLLVESGELGVHAKFAGFNQQTFLKMERKIGALGDDWVVRDHQHGLAVFLHQAMDQLHDFVGAFAVEVAGGLVAEQEGGIGDDGAGDGHALFLSAGELARVVIHALGKADDAERGLHVLAALGLGEFCEKQGQLDVLKGGEHGDEVVHLKDEADMARAPLRELVAGHVRDFIAGHGDAAVRGDVEAAKQIEQRGLAGAAGAHEADEVAFVHVQIEALQDLDFFAAATVSFVQSADLNQTVGFSSAIDSDHLSCSCYWRFIRLNPCQPGRSMLRPYTATS